MNSWRCLLEGGCQRDGDHYGTGAGIGCLASMNGACVKGKPLCINKVCWLHPKKENYLLNFNPTTPIVCVCASGGSYRRCH